MDNRILSLQWNNHSSAFLNCLNTLLQKEVYSDVTLACDGHFFPVHKLVLSVCSEYFEDIFKRTSCTKPVIILKDINHTDLESLLNYMYAGEANVQQCNLARLIKSAECLKIKGLAVSDDSPPPREKRRQQVSNIKAENNRANNDNSNKKRRVESINNYVLSTASDIQRLSDSDEITEVRRVVVQHTTSTNTSRSHIHTEQQVASHVPSRPSTGPSATPLQQQHQQLQQQIQQQQQQQHQIQQSRHVVDDDTVHDEALICHTMPEVLVEDGAAVKEEVKESIKEEGSNSSVVAAANARAAAADDDADSDDENDDGGEEGEEVQHHHQHSAGAGLMHDLLAIPGSSSQHQETLVSWDGSSAALAGYTLEGFIPDDLRHQQTGAVTGVEAAVVVEGGGTNSGSDNSNHHPNNNNNNSIICNNISAGGQVTVMGCPYCARAFLYRSDLSRHVRTHTGERPYTCPHCSYKASQKSHLLEHVKRRHRPAVSVASSSVSPVAATGLPGGNASNITTASGTGVSNVIGNIIVGNAGVGTASNVVEATTTAATSVTTAVGSTAVISSETHLVVPGGTLVVPGALSSSSLLVTTPSNTDSVGNIPSVNQHHDLAASVHHTILHTPSHTSIGGCSSASSAAICSPIASVGSSSHGLLFTTSTPTHSHLAGHCLTGSTTIPASVVNCSQALLYTPSHSPPQQATLHASSSSMQQHGGTVTACSTSIHHGSHMLGPLQSDHPSHHSTS